MSRFGSWRRERGLSTFLKEFVTLLILSIVITGCSGGGGGSDAPPANVAPAITQGCSNTNQSDALMGTLMATDADPISFSLDVNNPMVAGPIMTANGATVTLNTMTGDYTYTPSATGPRGMDSFDFRVDDPTTFSMGTETVIVNPKILPVGDSITLGSGGAVMPDDSVAYRLQLLNRLTDAGHPGGPYQIEYVGELSSGANLLPAGQRSHAGFGGCRDQDIAGIQNCFGLFPGNSVGIFDQLNVNAADIILLHIGTNPAVVDTDPGDLETILNEIDRWEDSVNGNPVTLFVMQIIPKLPADLQVDVYNQNVIARIADRLINTPMALPDNIVYGGNDDMDNLDMYTAFGGAAPNAAFYEGGTGLHPSVAGFTEMGNRLYQELTGPNQPAILQRCP